MKRKPTIRNIDTSHADQVLALGRKLGVLRAGDLAAHAIPRIYLTRLVESGKLERSSRGVYVVADAEVTENHSLAEVARRVPHGVVCLLSALQFHDLTTQIPHEVWLAISPKSRLPKMDYPPLRIVRFPAPALTKDVTVHTVEGVAVRITDPARTVIDCFAYRNKVGIDVAIEALRDCLAKQRATRDDLFRVAQSRRMANVIRPYLEATVA